MSSCVMTYERARRTSALLLVLAAAACGSDAATGTTSSSGNPETPQAKPGSPRTATLVGDPITAPVASPVTVSVKITDSSGVAVPNVIVNFVVTSGGGSVFAPAVASSASGIANQQWTFGTRAGSQTVEARWIDPVSASPRVLGVIAATATPGPMAKLAFATDSRVITVVNATVPLDSVVKWSFGPSASDQYGNGLPTTGVTYSVGTPLSLSTGLITSTVPAKAEVVATLGGLSASTGAVQFTNDVRIKWRASYACMGGIGAGNADDSVVVTATGTGEYSSSLPNRADVLFARVPVLGTRTIYQRGTPPIVQSLTDTLRLTQLWNASDIYGNAPGGFSTTAVYGESNLPFSNGMYAGSSWCGTGQWQFARSFRMEPAP